VTSVGGKLPRLDVCASGPHCAAPMLQLCPIRISCGALRVWPIQLLQAIPALGHPFENRAGGHGAACGMAVAPWADGPAGQGLQRRLLSHLRMAMILSGHGSLLPGSPALGAQHWSLCLLAWFLCFRAGIPADTIQEGTPEHLRMTSVRPANKSDHHRVQLPLSWHRETVVVESFGLLRCSGSGGNRPLCGARCWSSPRPMLAFSFRRAGQCGSYRWWAEIPFCGQRLLRPLHHGGLPAAGGHRIASSFDNRHLGWAYMAGRLHSKAPDRRQC